MWILRPGSSGSRRRQQAKILPHLPDQADWIVPTLVQFELAKWLARETSPETVEAVLAFSQRCRIVELSTDIPLVAADVAAREKLFAADAIILATADHRDATLLTCDAHFAAISRARYIAKE